MKNYSIGAGAPITKPPISPAATPVPPAPQNTSGGVNAYDVPNVNQVSVHDKENANIVNESVFNNPYLQQDKASNTAVAQGIANQNAAHASAAPQVQAAQAGTVTADQMFKNAQANTAQQLQQEANGQGPAAQAIQMQSQNATNAGIQAQLALANSQRGVNAGEALRSAQQGVAQVTGAAANQAAQNTLAAEQQGINSVGAVEAAGQNESISEAQLGAQQNQYNASNKQQADLQNQSLNNNVNLANAGADNAQQQFGDTALIGAQNNNNTMDLNQFGNTIEGEEYNAGNLNASEAADMNHSVAVQNANTAQIGTFAQLGGTVAQAFSDKRVKKDISKADKEIENFLNHLKAQNWTYKDQEKYGEGNHTGVMAQDLEKSSVGKQMVEEHDGVKMVNYTKGFATMMASLADINKRIKKLEGR